MSVVNAMGGEYKSELICVICGQVRKSSLLLQGSVYRAVGKSYKNIDYGNAKHFIPDNYGSAAAFMWATKYG